MRKKDLFNILIPASRVEKTINYIRLLKSSDNLDNKIKDAVLKAELFIAKKACEKVLYADLDFLSNISNIVFDGIYSNSGELRKLPRTYKYKTFSFNALDSKMISFEAEKLFDFIKFKFDKKFVNLRDKITLLSLAYTSILRIHPFYDGNEKVARLYTNYLALKLNFNIFDIAPDKNDLKAYEKYLCDLKMADTGVLEFVSYRIKKSINLTKKNIGICNIGPSASLAD